MKKLSIKPIPIEHIVVGVRFREELGDIESLSESIKNENIQRKELSWSEQANLVRKINTLMKEQTAGWTQAKTAELLKMSPGHVSDQLMIADVSESIPTLAEKTTFKDAVKLYRSLCTSIAETELSKYNRKTLDFNNFLEYIKHKNKLNKLLVSFIVNSFLEN